MSKFFALALVLLFAVAQAFVQPMAAPRAIRPVSNFEVLDQGGVWNFCELYVICVSEYV